MDADELVSGRGRTTLLDNSASLRRHVRKLQTVTKAFGAAHDCLDSHFLTQVREGNFHVDFGPNTNGAGDVGSHPSLADVVRPAKGLVSIRQEDLKPEIDFESRPAPQVCARFNFRHVLPSLSYFLTSFLSARYPAAMVLRAVYLGSVS